MIKTGPDGALWIADMYRAVIEHPEWIPTDWEKRLDLRAGSDKGRIYRVYPVDKKPRPIPRLDKLDTAGLVAALDSPSGWQRDTAQRMLIWKQDKAAVPLLEKMAKENKRPLARLHALCTLDGLDAVGTETLKGALADKHPEIRRHAVRLSERRGLREDDIVTFGVGMLADLERDPVVRLQLAYTIGNSPAPRLADRLATFAIENGQDPFITAAVMSSITNENLAKVVSTVLSRENKTPSPLPLVEDLLRMATAEKRNDILALLLTRTVTLQKEMDILRSFAIVAGFLDTLDRASPH